MAVRGSAPTTVVEDHDFRAVGSPAQPSAWPVGRPRVPAAFRQNRLLTPDDFVKEAVRRGVQVNRGQLVELHRQRALVWTARRMGGRLRQRRGVYSREAPRLSRAEPLGTNPSPRIAVDASKADGRREKCEQLQCPAALCLSAEPEHCPAGLTGCRRVSGHSGPVGAAWGAKHPAKFARSTRSPSIIPANGGPGLAAGQGPAAPDQARHGAGAHRGSLNGEAKLPTCQP